MQSGVAVGVGLGVEVGVGVGVGVRVGVGVGVGGVPSIADLTTISRSSTLFVRSAALATNSAEPTASKITSTLLSKVATDAAWMPRLRPL